MDIQCPYCKEHLDIDHDDGYGYGGDEYEQECGHCEKFFKFTTKISYDYEVFCNDDEHELEHDEGQASDGTRFKVKRCKNCDYSDYEWESK